MSDSGRKGRPAKESFLVGKPEDLPSSSKGEKSSKSLNKLTRSRKIERNATGASEKVERGKS